MRSIFTTNTTASLLLHFALVLSVTSFVDAFLIPTTTTSSVGVVKKLPSSSSSNVVVLQMADEPMRDGNGNNNNNNMIMGATERLLLDRKRTLDLGLVQELGRTVKKDGWDGVRAIVWSLYSASNIVFPLMAAVMMGGMCLNLMGYGYYWDHVHHQYIVDSLEHIRQENIYQMEVMRIYGGGK